MIADIEPSSEDWYGNAFWIDGRKCVLLVQVATLYSVLVLDIRVSDLRPPGGFAWNVGCFQTYQDQCRCQRGHDHKTEARRRTDRRCGRPRSWPCSESPAPDTPIGTRRR